jgi:acetyl esterase/lipase
MSNLCPRPLAILLRFALSVLVLPLVVHGTAAAQTCQSFSGLTYGTYPDRSGQIQGLGLDLLAPSGAGVPVPLVIWIHGGGWATGSRRPIPAFVSRLCSLGYAVASVDYRLTDVAIWPAQIEDVKGAVQFLRANAATYGLDPDRFAAWGESAGGQLAAMLGTSGGVGVSTLGAPDASVDLEGSTGGHPGVSSRVQAVVDWYGATDFVAMHFYPSTADHDDPRSDEGNFVGGPVQERPERVATANPATYASADDPPFLLMHGTADPLIPFNQSELLFDALLAQGVRATFVPVQNAGHGHDPWTSSTEIWQVVYDFLDRSLQTPPPVTVSVRAGAGGSEAGPPRIFAVSRTGGTAAPLTVRWALSGTAAPGADYTASPAAGAVTIPAGASFARVRIAPIADAFVEGDEPVALTLVSDPAYRIDAARGAAALTLTDSGDGRGLPTVAVESRANGQLTVTRTGSTATRLRVAYRLSGTAVPGVDYAALSGTVLLRPGAAAATVDLPPLPHERLEPATFAVLTLTPSALYRVGVPAAASVAFAADPLTKAVVAILGSDRAGAFLLSRTGHTDAPLTVRITLGGTARNGTDYEAVPGTVAFPPGANRVTVPIRPLAGGSGMVTLTVDPDPAYLVGPYAGRVTIGTPGR